MVSAGFTTRRAVGHRAMPARGRDGPDLSGWGQKGGSGAGSGAGSSMVKVTGEGGRSM
jgi:hypothetical protein